MEILFFVQRKGNFRNSLTNTCCSDIFFPPKQGGIMSTEFTSIRISGIDQYAELEKQYALTYSNLSNDVTEAEKIQVSVSETVYQALNGGDNVNQEEREQFTKFKSEVEKCEQVFNDMLSYAPQYIQDKDSLLIQLLKARIGVLSTHVSELEKTIQEGPEGLRAAAAAAATQAARNRKRINCACIVTVVVVAGVIIAAHYLST